MASLSELTQFIVTLSENPAKARRFRDDPNEFIERSALSDDSKKLLKSGPEAFMREVLASHAKPKPNIITQTNTVTHVNVNINNQTTTFVALIIL